MLWTIAVAANLAMLVGYTAICFAMIVPFIRSRQLFANRLGLATSLVFLTCAVHHGAHAVHIVVSQLGVGASGAGGLRASWSWPVVLWDVATAAAAMYYWNIRRSFGALFHSAALFEDLDADRRRALELNDNIVQGLTVAQLALALDERQRSRQAILTSLQSARAIISDLLGRSGKLATPGPGDLVRAEAARVTDRREAPPAAEGR
jgi:signal transduction histidine kinase